MTPRRPAVWTVTLAVACLVAVLTGRTWTLLAYMMAVRLE